MFLKPSTGEQVAALTTTKTAAINGLRVINGTAPFTAIGTELNMLNASDQLARCMAFDENGMPALMIASAAEDTGISLKKAQRFESYEHILSQNIVKDANGAYCLSLATSALPA